MGTETGEMGIKTGEMPKVWELKLGKWELKLGKSSLSSLIGGPLQTATYIKLQVIKRNK
jgi:F0F1-type ATP synthase epsilon subunit